jgi:ribosomal protein L7Ae-like RNA K-turn-binding protein
MEERIASYLSLANKAGKVVSGTDMVMQSLRKKINGRVVLLATDISADIRQKVIALVEMSCVEHFTLFNKDRLGSLIGKSLRSVVAVEGHGFVEAIKAEIERYRNFMGEVRNR